MGPPSCARQQRYATGFALACSIGNGVGRSNRREGAHHDEPRSPRHRHWRFHPALRWRHRQRPPLARRSEALRPAREVTRRPRRLGMARRGRAPRGVCEIGPTASIAARRMVKRIFDGVLKLIGCEWFAQERRAGAFGRSSDGFGPVDGHDDRRQRQMCIRDRFLCCSATSTSPSRRSPEETNSRVPR